MLRAIAGTALLQIAGAADGSFMGVSSKSLFKSAQKNVWDSVKGQFPWNTPKPDEAAAPAPGGTPAPTAAPIMTSEEIAAEKAKFVKWGVAGLLTDDLVKKGLAQTDGNIGDPKKSLKEQAEQLKQWEHGAVTRLYRAQQTEGVSGLADKAQAEASAAQKTVKEKGDNLAKDQANKMGVSKEEWEKKGSNMVSLLQKGNAEALLAEQDKELGITQDKIKEGKARADSQNVEVVTSRRATEILARLQKQANKIKQSKFV